MEENVPKQATEPMLTPEKTKKKSPVLTIILILFTIAGISFGVYGMCFNKPAEKECIESEVSDKTEPEEKTEGEKDYTIYYELINRYMDYDGYSHVKKFTTDGFDNIDYIASVAMRNIDAEYRHENSVDYTETVKYGGLLGTINYLFGNNDKYDDLFKNFSTGCAEYELSSNDSLQSRGLGCGGARGSKSVQQIKNVEFGEDTLMIDVVSAEIFYGLTDNDGKSDVILRDKTNNEVFSEQFEDTNNGELKQEFQKAEQYFRENIDDFQLYRLTFRKSNNYYSADRIQYSSEHYYLESGEKLN